MSSTKALGTADGALAVLLAVVVAGSKAEVAVVHLTVVLPSAGVEAFFGGTGASSIRLSALRVQYIEPAWGEQGINRVSLWQILTV